MEEGSDCSKYEKKAAGTGLFSIVNKPGQCVDKQAAPPNTAGYSQMAYSEIKAPMLLPAINVLFRSVSVEYVLSINGFNKLKFKGKGYYIYKNNRNTIALQFGYSHLLYLYSFFISIKFITKTTLLFFGVNYSQLLNISNNLYSIKKINIFTGKGIRFARQIIYRKTGKISSYR